MSSKTTTPYVVALPPLEPRAPALTLFFLSFFFFPQRVSLTEHSASEISWIGSFQLFMLFFLGLPAGRLYDMGYFRYLIAVGSLLLVFS